MINNLKIAILNTFSQKKSFVFGIGFIFYFFCSLYSSAQTPYTACFTSSSYRGCFPLTVNMTSCSASGPPAEPLPFYAYDFVNQPTVITQTTSFTYNTPGVYTLRQSVNNGLGNIVFTDHVIEVLGKPNPVFTAHACTGLSVRVVITDTNYDTFTINYGDGTIVNVAAGTYNHTYASTASVTLSVTGQYSVPCTGATVSKTITPFTTLAVPDIADVTVTSQAIATGTINLRYGGIVDRLYRIDTKINNGVYSSFPIVTAATSGINTQTINALNTQSNTYTYRIQSTDGCGNNSAFTSEIASIIINTTPLNGANEISYISNGGVVFPSIELLKSNLLLSTNPSNPYIDNNVTCGTDYCYAIQGTLPTVSSSVGANHKSYSLVSCLKATLSGTVPAISDLNSTVEGDNVKLAWNVPALNPASSSIGFYTLFRESNNVFENYGSSNENYYTDNGVNVNESPYCYKINYKDPCNALSSAALSNTTCTILLTVNRTEETNILNWTNYIGYTSGVKEYIVENLDESGNIILSKSVGLSNTLSETADPTLSQIIYRIKAIPNGNENIVSVSNIVQLDLTPVIFLPTIFTPNGDGQNDILELKGKYFKSAKITILNKWGEVVFISEDYLKGWDGTYKGEPASVDAYAYHVTALDKNGKEITLKGVVSLVR